MNNNIVSDEIAKMQRLYSYRMDEGKKKGQSVVEYHAKGADGKTYGIIKEGTKYYIKCAPVKDTEILAEDYDYIGGINEKKRYEYNSYAMASKQFDLKMMSINEAVNSNTPIDTQYDKQEASDWQINETREMRAELDRFNELTENVNSILRENNHYIKAVGIGSPKDADGNPYTEKANSEVKATKKNINPEDADETYCEDAKTVDEINKMTEKGDYRKAGEPFTMKVSKINEQVLTVNDNKEYVDTTKGTEIGSSEPYEVEKKCVCKDGECKCEVTVNEETVTTDEVEGFEKTDDGTYDFDIEIEKDKDEDGIFFDGDNIEEITDDDYAELLTDEGEICEKCGNSASECTCHECGNAANECGLNESNDPQYFGKHPAYGKVPFTTPADTENDRFGRDWNDKSAKGGRYGMNKGKTVYDEEIDLLVDNIVNTLLGKKKI